MSQWLLTINAVNMSSVMTQLRYSESGYVDGRGLFYEPRIISPALVTVAANDGGLLSAFSASSVGDVVLANADGGLAFLTTLALDGRLVELSFVDNTKLALTRYFSGTVAKVQEQADQIVVSLRAPQEALSVPMPMARFLGTNALPFGLEGDDSLQEQVKPIVLGSVKAVAPLLINSSLLIYQVSTSPDCCINEVFVGGVKLVRFKVREAAVVGNLTIRMSSTFPLPIDSFRIGTKITFGNSLSVYTVTKVALASGAISIDPALREKVALNASINVLDFYSSSAALQSLSSAVMAVASKGMKVVTLSLSDSINRNDWVQFSGHPSMYQVKSVSVSTGSITLKQALLNSVNLSESVFVVGDKPLLYGCFAGYIRLTSPPEGLLVVHCFSNASVLAGDVFEQVAGQAGLRFDGDSKALLNTAGGEVGVWLNTQRSYREVFDLLIKSVGGFYWIVDNLVFAQLLSVPSNLPVVIDDWQLLSVARLACGLGRNGGPIKSVSMQFDKIEVVQSSFAASVSKLLQTRFKTQFNLVSRANSLSGELFLLAEDLAFESVLRDRTPATRVAARLLSLASARCDVIELTCHYLTLAEIKLGASVRVVSPKLGYEDGRSLVVISLTLDCLHHTVTLRCIG